MQINWRARQKSIPQQEATKALIRVACGAVRCVVQEQAPRGINFAQSCSNCRRVVDVQAINGAKISLYMADRISHILGSYEGTTAGVAKLDAMTCGTERLSFSTFGQLRYLVEKSWTEFKHIFAESKG
ncbi:hypothetical protein N1937_28620 (plasmid) [Rhizobium sp. WSM4643]|uniref:hypothetical protein n=1 Tax=Rhizobium sp. WSM4643 TaxID=3138253 RepID=UPI0021A8CF87|nr:hypothetical protein [Rhizobium leguminosarum]UWM78759.1 hypothetical protein N1937_28620 [Rhizobium leguminosarum bv. viciae]